MRKLQHWYISENTKPICYNCATLNDHWTTPVAAGALKPGTVSTARSPTLRQHGIAICYADAGWPASWCSDDDKDYREQTSSISSRSLSVGHLRVLSSIARLWLFSEIGSRRVSQVFHSRLKTHLFSRSFPP